MEQIESGWGRLARWCLAAGSAATLAGIALVAVWFGNRQEFGAWWLAVGLGLVAAAAGWSWAGRRLVAAWRALGLPKWALPAALFAVCFAVKAFFALHFETEQQTDFLVMLQAAQDINEGDLSFNQNAYWHWFAYQTPFAIYEALMLRLSGGSLLPLLLVGALAMAGTNLLVYLMARRVSGSAAAGLFAALAYLAYPGPYVQANVLSNYHASTFLLLWGAYLILTALSRGPGWRAWALAAGGGIVLQFGNLARPSGIVVCAALVAASALTPVIRRRRGRSWRPLGRSLALCALALALYALVAAGAGAGVKASGINPAGVANNLPEWKFVLGLVPQAQMGSTLTDIDAYGAAPNPQAPAIAEERLERAIRDLPQQWRAVLRQQTANMWALNDSARLAFWPELASAGLYGVPDRTTATWAYLMVSGERGLFLPIMALAAAGVMLVNRRRAWNRWAVFLACLVVAFVAAHLVIEVMPRYRYLVMPAVFALAAPAWEWLARPGRWGSRSDTATGANTRGSIKKVATNGAQ